MGAPIRRELIFPATLGVALALPLIAVAVMAVNAALPAVGWIRLFAAPEFSSALARSLWVGFAATILAVMASSALCALAFNSARWHALARSLAPMLAVPHVAFAVGVTLLVAPSGIAARLFSPTLTGWLSPPAWQTVQDPAGLGLIACLTLKEMPFLLWAFSVQLAREDVNIRLRRELQVAQSFGYSPWQVWWAVAWPQVLAASRMPIFAVFAYGLTVVDIAIVIGPQSPPTLAQLAWLWIGDADLELNQQGYAAAALLTVVVFGLAGLIGVFARMVLPTLRRAPSGQRAALRSSKFRVDTARWQSRVATFALPSLFCAVSIVLFFVSFVGLWTFPDLLPQQWTIAAWQNVFSGTRSLRDTVLFGVASTTLALLWAVLWLEFAPHRWRDVMRPLILLSLGLPGIMWVIGMHRLAVFTGVDGAWLGVMLAHTLVVVPYSVVALSPAYLSFDARYAVASASLGVSRSRFLFKVKWPMLKASIASAAAIGFSVSVAQFLSTLAIGAGRFTTVTTEAVTQASGGARNVLAAHSALQWLLTMGVFVVALRVGQPRFFGKSA